MTEPLKEPCPVCHGAGTVPHLKRKLADGRIDPMDFQAAELCEKSGGSGLVPVNKAAIVERKPGFIVDAI